MPYIWTMRRRAGVLALLLVLGLTLLSGCFTGRRPSVTTDAFPPGSPSGDPSIDQVLALLDMVNDGPVHRRLHRVDQVRKHHPPRHRRRRRRRADRSRSERPLPDHQRLSVADVHPRQDRPLLVDPRAGPHQRHPDHSRLLLHTTPPNDCDAPPSPESARRSPASRRSPGSRRPASTFPFPAVSRSTASWTTARWPASTTARWRSTSPSSHRRSTSRCSRPPDSAASNGTRLRRRR